MESAYTKTTTFRYKLLGTLVFIHTLGIFFFLIHIYALRFFSQYTNVPHSFNFKPWTTLLLILRYCKGDLRDGIGE